MKLPTLTLFHTHAHRKDATSASLGASSTENLSTSHLRTRASQNLLATSHEKGSPSQIRTAMSHPGCVATAINDAPSQIRTARSHLLGANDPLRSPMASVGQGGAVTATSGEASEGAVAHPESASPTRIRPCAHPRCPKSRTTKKPHCCGFGTLQRRGGGAR